MAQNPMCLRLTASHRKAADIERFHTVSVINNGFYYFLLQSWKNLMPTLNKLADGAVAEQGKVATYWRVTFEAPTICKVSAS
jgi:hypothetical protein